MLFDEYYKARDILEDLLKKDLYGPVQKDEVIEGSPQKYYATGILFPQKTVLDEEENRIEEIEEDEKKYDSNVNLSNSYNPSSMAISTTIKPEVNQIQINIKIAKYELLEEDLDQKFNYIRISDTRWGRTEYDFQKQIEIPEGREKVSHELLPGLSLHLYIQLIFDDGSKTITASISNDNQVVKDYIENNKNTFFQPNMKLSSCKDDSEIFIPKKTKLDINKDDEVRRFDMLYSHVKNYAVGHGCSVGWNEGEKFATEIYSSFLPDYELKQMKPAINTDENIFRMKYLAESKKEQIVADLKKFIKSYDKWIMGQDNQVSNLTSEFEDVAKQNIDRCNEVKDRIYNCINLFNKDDMIFDIFQWTNKVMFKQREKHLKKNGKKIDSDNIRWYPFQLAFLLLEIPSIVDPKNDYRDIVDLIWFPTGGGKTEAYLGLAAFTIFYRRHVHKEAGRGVAVIMRYTLRLLTVQQFERAAALICACEYIRKQENIDDEEISIGLWVGGGLTPNKLEDAKENLNKVKNDDYIKEGNPCQLLICPWCGTEITPNNYNYNNKGHSIYCQNEDCDFHNGLPVYLIDEEIYNVKPTFIISTIDKYARMTWEPKVGEIFGINSKYNPPELIIQDELHLISGPLGTIAGLYEIAINRFCKRGDINAKVIASTATIRNAKEQIKALYGREHREFPPQGLNIRDSYFAEVSRLHEKPGRKYVGILTPGKSPTTMLVRVYACILFATRYLIDKGFSEEVIDSYWTLVGYFNSLRELGGASRQIVDDVQDRFDYLRETKFNKLSPKLQKGKGRYDWFEELTSRKSNSKISRIIQKDLKVGYPESGALDFVLASNMISVGVDVDRLGLMLVTGQPKTNAEYIQATSRVGRSTPGLVLTMYSSGRSRDRSHYEQFIHYHSALYKFVEATSLTPFSERAREKALDAVYISLCRHLVQQLKPRDAAGNFNENIEKIKEIEDYIISHAEKIESSEVKNIKEELEQIKGIWNKFAGYSQNEFYQTYGTSKDNGKPLLKNRDNEIGIFRIMNSMRNVDAQSNIFLEEG